MTETGPEKEKIYVGFVVAVAFVKSLALASTAQEYSAASYSLMSFFYVHLLFKPSSTDSSKILRRSARTLGIGRLWEFCANPCLGRTAIGTWIQSVILIYKLMHIHCSRETRYTIRARNLIIFHT